MSERARVTVVGGGPAGACAAAAAAKLGADTTLFEQSPGPKHRVCGEFLSPEIVPVLESIGAWRACLEAGAVPVRRMLLRFERRTRVARLPGPAYGLSRFTLDRVLLDTARNTGAAVVRARYSGACAGPLIDASGRAPTGRRPGRLFGFKAHFEGPVDDAVELYFGRGVYVGVNAVETAHTNVCGLASEHVLARFEFDFDAVCRSIPALEDRLRPMQRSWKWLATGPVEFRPPARSGPEASYPAGDALSFVDPFTGAGIANAAITGTSAGRAAAAAQPVSDYLRESAYALARANRWAATFRTAVQYGVAEYLAPFLPPSALFRLTRPRAIGLAA